MTAAEFDEEFTDFERKIHANVDKHGCHINYVFDPEGNGPAFAYSVGVSHSVGQGEVIVFGLRQDVMHSMINETLRQCRDDDLLLSDGLRLSGLVDGFDVIAKIIPPAKIELEHFNSAMWYHVGRFGTPLTLAYQLVWPSSVSGLYPWEPGCQSDVIAAQPALYETSLN